MHYLKLSASASSVKMYPRLAMASRPHKPKPSMRTRRVRSLSASTEAGRQTAHQQVRARLLHMILENERVRRHEQHPNAS
jgi:hypothetical protein